MIEPDSQLIDGRNPDAAIPVLVASADGENVILQPVNNVPGLRNFPPELCHIGNCNGPPQFQCRVCGHNVCQRHRRFWEGKYVCTDCHATCRNASGVVFCVIQ